MENARGNSNGFDESSGMKCRILPEFCKLFKDVPTNAKSYAVSCFDTMGLSSAHYYDEEYIQKV